jgi:hypothetical protein
MACAGKLPRADSTAERISQMTKFASMEDTLGGCTL